MALVVSKRDRNLLVRSHVTQDPAWFKRLLEDNDSISEEMLTQMDDDQQTFLRTMVKPYVAQATKEWTADNRDGLPTEDLGDERTTCSLCGNPDNRYVYYAVNRVTGDKMNIGSSCKDEFGFQLSQDGRTDQSLMRDAIRLRAESELVKEFHDIVPLLRRWDDEVDRFPVLVPSSLSTPYLQYGDEAKQLFDGYVNRKLHPQKTISRLRHILEQHDDLLRQMDRYSQVMIAKGSLFTPTRAIVRWLQNNGEDRVIEKLSQEGQIQASTVSQICEPTFMNAILPRLQDVLADSGIELTSTDPDRKRYLGAFGGVDIAIRHEKLLKECAGKVFNLPFTTLDRMAILTACSVRLTEKSARTYILSLSEDFRRFGFKLFQRHDDAYRDDVMAYQGFSIDTDTIAFESASEVHEFSLRSYLHNLWPTINGLAKNPSDYLRSFLKTGKRQPTIDYEDTLKSRRWG